jgi:hypothetical protein
VGGMIYGIKEMFVVDFVNEKDTVTVLDSTFFSFSSCEKKGGWSQKSEGSFFSGLGYIRIEDIGRDWEEAIAVNNNGWRGCQAWRGTTLSVLERTIVW